MDFFNIKRPHTFLYAALAVISCLTSCQLPISGENTRKQISIDIPNSDLFTPIPTTTPGAFFVADRANDIIHFIQVDWEATPPSHNDKSWPIPGGKGDITAMDISPDGRWLAVVTNDPASLFMLDTRSGILEKIPDFGDDPITSVAFGADETVYVGTFGVNKVGRIRTFARNSENSLSEGPPLSKSDGYIVGRSPRHTTLFTSDQPQDDTSEPSVTQWLVSANPGTLIISYPFFGNGAVSASKLSVAPAGDIVLGLTDGSKTDAGHLPRYRLTGSSVEELPYLFPEYTPTAAAFAPSGERVVVAHSRCNVNSTDGIDRHNLDDPHLHVFDASTANDIAQLKIPGESVDHGLFVDIDSNIYVLIREYQPKCEISFSNKKPSQQIYAVQP